MLAQKQIFMYNIVMKKISVLLILALGFACLGINEPCNAGIFTNFRNNSVQKKVYNSTIKDIRTVIELQDSLANKQDIEGIEKLYSDNFINSDGFDKNSYIRMIKETWETYPDISYFTEINHIEFSDNYATVFVNETAFATSQEGIGEYETVGELYSTAKCVYYLEKQGNSWLINSERVIEETSSLKYGDARYMDIKLEVPKQIGSNKAYTATLKVNATEPAIIVGSITREKIVYPQTKSEDSFRKISDNVLERVFTSNSDNVNEYAMASIGITHAHRQDETSIKVYMSGMAFIMTRVNVIPENKFIKTEEE